MSVISETCIVKFYAKWCRPCLGIAQPLKEVAEEANIDLIEVDIDEDIQTASKYFVKSLPTVIAIKDSAIVDMHVGVADKERYLKMANKINKEK